MVKDLFEKIALVETVDTAHLSVAGTVCGCTPAYAAMFIEALADAGVKHGLTRAQAYRFAAQMLVGTGKLHLETGQSPRRDERRGLLSGRHTIRRSGLLWNAAVSGLR